MQIAFDDQDLRTLKELLRTGSKHIHFEKEIDSVTGDPVNPVRRLALTVAAACLRETTKAEAERIKGILEGGKDQNTVVFFEALCKTPTGDLFRHFADTMTEAIQIEGEVFEVHHWSIAKEEHEKNPVVFARGTDPHRVNQAWTITKVPYV